MCGNGLEREMGGKNLQRKTSMTTPNDEDRDAQKTRRAVKRRQMFWGEPASTSDAGHLPPLVAEMVDQFEGNGGDPLEKINVKMET